VLIEDIGVEELGICKSISFLPQRFAVAIIVLIISYIKEIHNEIRIALGCSLFRFSLF
jgi:hypothetical protein